MRRLAVFIEKMRGATRRVITIHLIIIIYHENRIPVSFKTFSDIPSVMECLRAQEREN
jgi:hypothetical protein